MNTGYSSPSPRTSGFPPPAGADSASSHLLADFRESPELYRRKTAAKSPGFTVLSARRAAHRLITEGRAAFDEQFLVADGVNLNRRAYGKA